MVSTIVKASVILNVELPEFIPWQELFVGGAVKVVVALIGRLSAKVNTYEKLYNSL